MYSTYVHVHVYSCTPIHLNVRLQLSNIQQCTLQRSQLVSLIPRLCEVKGHMRALGGGGGGGGSLGTRLPVGSAPFEHIPAGSVPFVNDKHTPVGSALFANDAHIH